MYNLLQVEEFKVDLSLTKTWLDDRRRVLVACVGDGRRESVLLSKEMQSSKVELSLSSLDLAHFYPLEMLGFCSSYPSTCDRCRYDCK